MLTTISSETLSEDEHNIAVLLTGEPAKQAAHLQDRLVQIFGDAIWLQRPPSLHSTVMEIICKAEYRGLSRKQHFQQWYDQHNQTVKDVLAGCPRFDITFSELYVSQAAIIIKAVDSAPLNEIRRKLLSKMTLPEGTKQPPEITHCTLARFAKAIDLEDARRRMSDISVNILQPVRELALFKDMGPPRFNGTPMQVYSLSIR